MTETTTETKELALFPKLNLPTVTGITEQMNKSFGTMYTRIEAGIAALPTDMSIKKNREEVASYAYDIARTKTGLDKAAADVSGEAKQIVDAVNAERRQLKDTLDTLKAKARAKLDAWEALEKDRIERVRDLSSQLAHIEIQIVGMTSDQLEEFGQEVAGELTEILYGESLDMLKDLQSQALATIGHEIENAKRREAEARELEQLRREKAEREAADAKAAAEKEFAGRLIAHIKAAAEGTIDGQSYPIALLLHELQVKVIPDIEAAGNYAAEIENCRQEALRHLNEMAERQAEESRRAAEEEARQKAAREAQEKIDAAEKAAADAEAQRIHEAEQARKREIEAEEARQREAEEAEARRIREADEAAERQRQAEERARQEERDRIEQERAEEERQRLAKEKADQERAADLAHRKKVNSAAVDAIMKASGISEKDAQAVVVAIYKEQIPHVSIRY